MKRSAMEKGLARIDNLNTAISRVPDRLRGGADWEGELGAREPEPEPEVPRDVQDSRPGKRSQALRSFTWWKARGQR